MCVRALLCSSSVLQAKKQAQRVEGLCPGSQSQDVVAVGLESNSGISEFRALSGSLRITFHAIVGPNEGVWLHAPGGTVPLPAQICDAQLSPSPWPILARASLRAFAHAVPTA